MSTATKRPVPQRVKPSFVVFDIRALCSPEHQSARMSTVTNDQLNPVRHRMLYSCTHMAMMDFKRSTAHQHN